MEDESYSMEKALIIEAWSKYRPSLETTPRDDGEKSPARGSRKKDI